MQQLGFLDCQIRLQRIDTAADPLVRLDETIDRERFRPLLEQARKTLPAPKAISPLKKG